MRKLSFLILLLAVLGTTKSYAGWPIGKYRNIFVPNFNYYHATNSWDANGNKIKGLPGNGFDSYSMNLYFGYGLGRRWNLISTLPVVYQKSRFSNANGSGGSEGYGPQDLQVGLDYNLINFNYERFFSVQVSGIAPLYNVNSAHGNIGYGQGGAELKFSYCGNIPKRLIKGSYFNVEVFGRRYFGAEGPMQFTGYGLLGFNVSKRDQITVDAVYIKSISTNKDFSSNLVNIKDYELGKTSLNFGHSFTRRVSVFVGGFYTVYGRNTAEGVGGSVSTILKL